MKLSGLIRYFCVAALLLIVSPLFATSADVNAPASLPPPISSATLNIPAPPARMSPELALEVHDARVFRQARELGEYKDVTTIDAELPQTAQKGRYQLLRMFSAPKSLAFKAVNFVGDGFVKTNVIARLLQSEVNHAEKGPDDGNLAITTKNYKFNYKGLSDVNGHLVHVYQVKPRHKRVGLFKGMVYLDVYTGAIRRAEGKMVKSPSFFVKNIQFVQDYAEVNGFDLVSHIHSTADARIVGKTIIDITHKDFEARRIDQVQTSTPSTTEAPMVRTVSLNSGR